MYFLSLTSLYITIRVQQGNDKNQNANDELTMERTNISRWRHLPSPVSDPEGNEMTGQKDGRNETPLSCTIDSLSRFIATADENETKRND